MTSRPHRGPIDAAVRAIDCQATSAPLRSIGWGAPSLPPGNAKT